MANIDKPKTKSEIKVNKVKVNDVDIGGYKQRNDSLDVLLRDYRDILKTNDTEPTHTPKNFLECFYLYKNDTDYRLYIYINNEWKYSTLS